MVQNFSKRYNEYVKMAEAGKMRDFNKIPARAAVPPDPDASCRRPATHG